MTQTKKRNRRKPMLNLLPATLVVTGAAQAGPPKPPAPPPPPPPPQAPPAPAPALPPIPQFVNNNVMRITGLSLAPALPKVGETVTVKLTVLNESAHPLSNVDWTLTGAVSSNGKISVLPPRSSVSITRTFTAQAGTASVRAEIDPARRVNEASELRQNNTAGIKTAVSSDSSTEWATWAQKAAAQSFDFLEMMKATTSIEGEINGPVLKVKKLKVGSFSTTQFKQKLMNAGLPSDVAQAVVDCLVKTYTDWAANYQAVVPFAYPGFAAYPAAQAAPMPNVPFALAIGGGPAANQVIKPPTIESTLKGKLTAARKNAPGAASAIQQFSVACAGQFGMWMSIRMVGNVMGRGTVPSFAPPYVPVGPVVGGDNIAAPSHVL